MASVSRYEPRRPVKGPDGAQVVDPATGRKVWEKTGETVWRARYRDEAGREHARHFPRKVDAQRWLDEVASSVVTGTYVDPATARITVEQWCHRWLQGYGTRRASTVRQAQIHVKTIVRDLGHLRLGAVKPSDVKSWTVGLGEEYAPSTVYALHSRLAQIMSDAVHDGVIPRSPCSRRTSPPMARPRAFVATTEQVWSLHDAFPEHLRPAVLLGAFVGLRVAEAAALRHADVDYLRGVVTPAIQWPAEPLKTETSRTGVPIPLELATELSVSAARFAAPTVVTDEIGRPAGPWAIEREVRRVRAGAGLPGTFRFHDLRHYFASLLIASGLDVKVVQTRLRHASAKTTLDVYGHLWPDKDESARAAVAGVLAARADFLRTSQTL